MILNVIVSVNQTGHWLTQLTCPVNETWMMSVSVIFLDCPTTYMCLSLLRSGYITGTIKLMTTEKYKVQKTRKCKKANATSLEIFRNYFINRLCPPQK